MFDFGQDRKNPRSSVNQKAAIELRIKRIIFEK